MKAACPQCGHIYDIPDNKIPEKGTFGRCRLCGTRFPVVRTPLETQTKASRPLAPVIQPPSATTRPASVAPEPPSSKPSDPTKSIKSTSTDKADAFPGS
ncbi:MAG: zinc-ribbon domain-containing protein, partial [Deltaproteobacteria bacterium]|nr:zinc-ribbon domain-containing protein [Deltaproteobacteria bacterium]